MSFRIAVREHVGTAQREHAPIRAADRSRRHEAHVRRTVAQIQRAARQDRLPIGAGGSGSANATRAGTRVRMPSRRENGRPRSAACARVTNVPRPGVVFDPAFRHQLG